ncbi:accessory Sec system protein Asp1 [Lactiplantibacillus plantarum]|uniref:accessory Sec system protein Asp1 n=1 Tax=Lactiplantibacillus plantarum TaxID=1590 RepID=UPI0020066A34|nr:accessory Sec system protein Asp1 [Lactiplantibacillus plantarum]MCK6240591.1 accessory Sec system protein Asp1 [Lactiplantibacillus plantarum]
MFYFIPSLYEEGESWQESDPVWFRHKSTVCFDGFTNYLRMLERSDEEAVIFVPEYAPNLRHYLYRQGIRKTKVVSLFDKIQNITSGLEISNFNYRELDWPSGVEFVYNPFAILAYRHGERFARILHGIGGNIVRIEFYRENIMSKVVVFDERGFISRIDLYEKNGTLTEKRYFNDVGMLQLVEKKDGLVIRSNNGRKESYTNTSSLVRRSLKEYFNKYLTANDVVLVAADENKMKSIVRSFTNKKVILSCSSSRPFDYDWIHKNSNTINGIILDSDQYWDSMSGIFGRNVRVVPPINMSLSPSRSIQKTWQRIIFRIDGLSDDDIYFSIRTILEFISQHDNIYLTIFSHSDFDNRELLTSTITDAGEGLFTINFSDECDIEKKPKRYCIDFYAIKAEEELVRLVGDSRILIDLAANPNVFIQMIGLSLGVPQINTHYSGYVDNNTNGMIIASLGSELRNALVFYLLDIDHWNVSLADSIGKIRRFYDENIINTLEGIADD